MTTVANLLTNIGYRLFPDGSTTIGTTSEPTQAECIQWMNETCEEILTICVELNSEIGRTAAASITLADGTPSYNDLAATLFCPVIYMDKDGENFSGWIEKTSERNPLKLITEADVIDIDPSLEKEPECFYLDGSNNLIFVPTPDATYTAKIPYYGYLTALTATGDTVPFLRVFDHVITESIVMRAQNREEYELGFELNWFKYIRKQARKIIMMRRNPTTKITV